MMIKHWIISPMSFSYCVMVMHWPTPSPIRWPGTLKHFIEVITPLIEQWEDEGNEEDA